MRRIIVVGIWVLAFLIVRPAPAHAWWYWLDEYSGPGPFWGADVQFRVACVQDSRAQSKSEAYLWNAGRRPDVLVGKVEAEVLKSLKSDVFVGVNKKIDPDRVPPDGIFGPEVTRENSSEFYRLVDRVRRSTSPGSNVLRTLNSFDVSRDQAGRPLDGEDALLVQREGEPENVIHNRLRMIAAAALGAGCVTRPDVNPSGSLNVRVAYYRSVHNGLEYANGDSPMVNLLEPEVSFSVFLDDNKAIEFQMGTVGVSIPVFVSRGHSRFYWKPVVINVTPHELFRTPGHENTLKEKLARSFTISTGITVIPKGFNAGDVGAVPGSFKVDREILGFVGFVFDLSRF